MLALGQQIQVGRDPQKNGAAEAAPSMTARVPGVLFVVRLQPGRDQLIILDLGRRHAGIQASLQTGAE